jgi:pantoate--beta-alanine ligase
MAADLNFPLRVVVCPTLREADGLAMSSRNAYLSPAERQAAAVLYLALSAARDAYAGGERNAEALRAIMRRTYEREPAAQVQYISVADPDTLEEMEHVTAGALVSTAALIGSTRLIDNFLLP